MTIDSISNASNTYTQSLLNSTSGANSVTSSSFTTPQDGPPQLSPLAQILSKLQQLQQQNPSQFQQITAQIATNLQNAAATAQADGNTTQAKQLTQLSTQFETASQSGQLPGAQALQQAAGGHHHHHHGGGSGDSSTSNSSSTLSQLFTNSETNSDQSQSLNPFSIILNTLSSFSGSGSGSSGSGSSGS